MLKPTIVYLYQAIRTGDRKQMVTSVNPGAQETKDCDMTFDQGLLKVTSEKWPEDIYVGLANIRSMNVEKDKPKKAAAAKK